MVRKNKLKLCRTLLFQAWLWRLVDENPQLHFVAIQKQPSKFVVENSYSENFKQK